MNPLDSKDKVTISTVHSAKGLEAKVCYVVNVSVGSYPSSRTLDEGEDAIEEERRVLYVALTRAKDKLYLTRVITCIQNYDSLSNSEQLNPSILGDAPTNKPDNHSPCKYFLDELPDNLAVNEISEQTLNGINAKTYFGSPITEDEFGMDLS